MGERTGDVWRGRRGSDAPDDDEAESGAGPRGGRGRGVTGLVALAISGVVLYLAWCVIWERSHPAHPAARAVRTGETAGRLRAVADLERFGPEDPDVVFPALIAALGDPSIEVRSASASALVMVIQGVGVTGAYPQHVADAVKALLAGTRDPEAGVRTSAVQSLWMVVMLWQGAPRLIDLDAIEVTVAEAAGDPDANVRLAAVRGLGVVGQRLAESPPPELVAALEDESAAVRDAAALALVGYPRGLVRLLPVLVKSLESTRPQFRPAYLNVLKRAGPTLSLSGKVWDQEVVAALVATLGSRDREVRHQAVVSLGEFGSQAREAIPALAGVLDEANEARSADPEGPPGRGPGAGPDLVVAAARSIGSVARNETMADAGKDLPGAREAVAALAGLLRSSDARRRAAAITALRSFDPDAALVPALSEAVADRDAAVRAAALWALHDYALKLKFEAPKAILDALEDGAPEVRAAAAGALARIRAGVEPMVPALLRHAARDPAAEVRDACSFTLREIRPPAVTAAVVPLYSEAIDSRESPPGLRRNLIEALGPFGPAARDALPAIIRTLRSPRDEDPRRDSGDRAGLAQFAARALGELAPNSPAAGDAILALTEALDDPFAFVRASAARALESFGPAARSALPGLIRFLRQARDGHSGLEAAAAADAVRMIAPGTPEEGQALSLLIDLLDERSNQHVATVIDAVARFGPKASAALPRLREMTDSRDAQTSEAAAKAVAALERPGR